MLDDIFCLTFVKGVDEVEALRRMGGLPDTVATRTQDDIEDLHNFDAGHPSVASALPLGDWTAVYEPRGFEGSRLVAVMSRGTVAVSVLRHDHASHRFGYAVDGELMTGFDPTFPTHRHGAGPDRLYARMLDVGFDLDGDGFQFDGAVTRSLALAETITGVMPSSDDLAGPLTSAFIEPWFIEAGSGDDRPDDPVAEARRLADLHGVADTAGLADALAAVERSEPVTVPPDSPLAGRRPPAGLTHSSSSRASAATAKARLAAGAPA